MRLESRRVNSLRRPQVYLQDPYALLRVLIVLRIAIGQVSRLRIALLINRERRCLIHGLVHVLVRVHGWTGQTKINL